MVFSKSYSKTPGLFAAFFVLLVLLSGCAQYVPPQNNGVFVPLKEIPRFNSYEEIFATMKASIGSRGYGYGMQESMSAPGASSSDSGGKSVNYSRTNIQVEGVDEADIVKTDGKYIYNFSNRILIITDAYPLESSAIVSKTALENLRPIEMFIQGDRLVLFARKYASYDGPRPLDDMMRYPYYGSSETVVLLYDVSTRSAPVVVKEFEFSGDYLSSRLIGENAYFVVSARPYFYFDEPGILPSVIVPKMSEDGVERFIALPQDIGYLPPMPAESFVTIASLNVATKELQKETIVGSAENLFASQNNIYLAATSWFPEQLPVLEGDILPVDVEREETTVINKFRLENGKIGFVGQGSVPGHVLNQFSMDEFEQNFRIATTTGSLWGVEANQSKNNLYVLDKEMNLIGSLEDLAPGEKIYSARFMGKRAYMVTFKKVDPLFVIDVSEPTNPRVLGKLKIPGYSDYLHPFDETHLIGVGKDTIEASDELVEGRGLDFAWYQGLKLAIFDVSNVENPIELHKIVIGDRGTDSYALDDHKAFLFDKEKELLVLPIELAEIPKEDKKPLDENQRSPAYGMPVFQGAFVFKVNLAEGFVERGRITHISGEEELKSGYYYPQESNVKRALFIENVLYTLSDKMLKANALDTLQPLKEFVFSEFK